MKKLLIAFIIVLAVALTIALCFGVNMKNNASVGIIGGADGPTAIFVSGSVVFGALIPVVAVILLAAVIIGIVLRKKK